VILLVTALPSTSSAIALSTMIYLTQSLAKLSPQVSAEITNCVGIIADGDLAMKLEGE
jgi:hypothetical protein